MNLDKIAIETKVLSPWAAADLGLQFAKQGWLTMAVSWLIGPACLMALFNIFLPSYPYVGIFTVWWLKPFWDRLPLFYLSRALFSSAPTIKEMYKQFFSIMRFNALPWLLWRRFSITRSFVLPVTLLEQLKGSARGDRVQVLQNNGSFAPTGITMVFLHVEQLLPMALATIVLMFIPEWESVDYWGLWEWLATNNASIWLSLWVTVLGMACLAPFYVGAGFMMYICRRIELEGWDIEIAFRKISSYRLPQSTALALALTLLLFITPAFNATVKADTMLEDIPLEQPSNSEQARARSQIIEVLEGKDFYNVQEIKRWQKKDRTRSDNSWLEDWLKDLFDDSEGEISAETLATVALVLEIILWVAVALIIGLFVYKYRHAIGIFSDIGPPPSARKEAPPSTLFGLDITPQSLPENISDAAHSLLQKGHIRQAIGLLYRASLSNVVNHDQITLHKALTELECNSVIKAGVKNQTKVSYINTLTHNWLDLAYAHEQPNIADLESLCKQWADIFNSPNAHNEATQA